MQFLESERLSVLSSAPPSLQANLSLWDAIEKLVHKVRGKLKLHVFHRDEEHSVVVCMLRGVKDELGLLCFGTDTCQWSGPFRETSLYLE